MTEKEAVQYWQQFLTEIDQLENERADVDWDEQRAATIMAIKTLEKQSMVNELLNECKELKKELDAYKTIGNEDANAETRQILTDLAFNEEKIKDFKEVKALQKAVIALKEIQQYRAIGTVEQCREAVERMKHGKELKEYEVN